MGSSAALQQVEGEQQRQRPLDEDRDPRHVVAAALASTGPPGRSRKVGVGLGH